MSRDICSLPPHPADRRIRYGEDQFQFVDLWTPAAANAVAMVIHGGYWRAKWDLQYTSHMCAALAKAGIAVANVEYRRVGNAGGGWPGTYQDIRSAYAAVRTHFGAEKKYIAIGHSSGGHLALRLAVDASELAGVLALAPVAVLQTAYDLNLSNGAVVDFLRGTPASIPQVYADACPARHSSSVQRIVLHGSADEDVPISISRQFEEARQHDPGTVWFMKLDQCDHFDLVDPESRAWPIVHMDAESLIE